MANLYLLIHLPVLPAWLMLIVMPEAKATRQLVHSGLIPLLMGAVYAAFLTAGMVFGQAAEGAGMGSLAGIMALMSHPVGALTGWAHFLVFDLFVGAWVARDARAQGFGHAGTVPVLLLTLVFGPLGLAAHVLRRLVAGKGMAF